MAIHFDREKPAEDRFAVQFLDANGQLARHEDYTREEITRAVQDLWHDAKEPPDKRAARAARWACIHELFPERKATREADPARPRPVEPDTRP